MRLPGAGGLLADAFGRTARDLRVSVTDRCNLRCTYCMPADGLPATPEARLLTDAETVRLVRIAVELLGITKIRFTGGEPLIRPGITELVAAIAALSPRPELSLTTNGIGLDRLAPGMAAAGLDRINISLDTLDRAVFARLARRDRLDDVLRGIDAAAESGLAPVKINSVLMRGVNDGEAPKLVQFCLERGYELRFIEQMPLDPMHRWSRQDMVTADEIMALLSHHWTLTADPAHRGASPAETWLIDGGPASVGIIASITRPFCADCDRARLTADGQVRTCLFARRETDLRGLLRAGASDRELADAWITAAAGKAAAHGVNDVSFEQPARPMSAIGG